MFDLNKILKDLLDIVKQIFHMKTFWIVLVLTGMLVYFNNQQYKGIMVSRGVEGPEISMRNKLQDYDSLVRNYEEKTGNKLDSHYVSSNKVFKSGIENGEDYHISAGQVFTRFYHKPFSITGQVILKVRMPDSKVDYLEVSTGKDIYGIYFMDSLPPQLKGDTISVTGIVLGRVQSGKANETVLASSYLNVNNTDSVSIPNNKDISTKGDTTNEPRN